MYNILQLQLRLGLLVATFGLVVSCLITNCPRGGKRGDSSLVQNSIYPEPNTNYCIPCGPGDQGVCIGKNICCGREGCFAGSRHTQACRNIKSTRTSCLSEVNIQTCGDKGRCKAKYLCCSKDQCVVDPLCKSMPPIVHKDANDASTPTYNLHGLALLLQSLKDMGDINQDISSEIWKSRNDASQLYAAYSDS